MPNVMNPKRRAAVAKYAEKAATRGSPFQVGMVVEARAVIVDKDSHGQPYIHATPGMLGVVVHIERDVPEEWPTVNWEPQGHGVCDTDPRYLEIYPGAVHNVVD